MRRTNSLLLVLFCCVSMSTAQGVGAEGTGGAQTPEGTVKLDEIVVTGTRITENVEKPNMTVIIPSSLLQGPGSTLDAALKHQPGIDVQRPQEVGASMDDDSIKIRGFGARRIVLSVDGMPQNSPGTAGGYFIDWSTVPLSNVQEIEVIKGVSDPRYGSTLGGVVNLITKKPQKRPEIEAQGSAGSFGTKTFDFYHGWKPSAFEYSLSGGYSESNGYLYNGDFRIKNVGLHLGYELPWRGKIAGDMQYVEVRKGFIVPNRISNDPDSPNYDVPKNSRYPASDGEIMYGGMGVRGQPEAGSWWRKEKTTYNLNYQQEFDASRFKLRYWQNYGNREAYNTRMALGRVYHKEFYDDRSYGADGIYTLELPNNTITMGLDYKRLKDDGDRNYADDFRAPSRNYNYVNSINLGAFIMDDIFLQDKKLILTPGIRYSSYDGKAGPAGRAEGIRDVSMDGFAPSLKATYAYAKDSLTYLSLARALRMPTPPEHYWHYSPDAGVNTRGLSFNKEDGIMVQGGWKASLPGRTKIEISPYYYRIKDYIQFDVINFVSYNIEKAEIYGVEAGITHQLTKYFAVFANYTYQKSKTSGDPFVNNFVDGPDRGFDEVPGLPGHKVNGGIQYKGQRKEKVTLYMTAVSSQKVIYNNNVLSPTSLKVRTQPGYITVDVEGSYPFTSGIELTAYVRNLFDAGYQERFGFPAAERNFGIGLRTYF
jgi:outer membrane receptor protein involved in Fe transport